jgi:predicted DCC family thiol-disulfide oxidoreductase YuxK
MNISETNIPEAVAQNPHIIVFDGVCNLCSGWVSFVYNRDIAGRFKFVSVQSELGKELLIWCGLPTNYFSTMVYIENGQAYFKSSAFLYIVKWLKFPWPPMWLIGRRMPKFMRDWLYSRVALNRYRLFGKRSSCLVPTGQLAARFL